MPVQHRVQALGRRAISSMDLRQETGPHLQRSGYGQRGSHQVRSVQLCCLLQCHRAGRASRPMARGAAQRPTVLRGGSVSVEQGAEAHGHVVRQLGQSCKQQQPRSARRAAVLVLLTGIQGRMTPWQVLLAGFRTHGRRW